MNIHQIDAEALRYLSNIDEPVVVQFPETSEMKNNTRLIVNHLNSNSSQNVEFVKKEDNSVCPVFLVTPFGNPENVALGFRGANWKTADQLLSEIKTVFGYSQMKLDRRFVYTGNSIITGVSVPSLSSTLTLKEYNWSYGWDFREASCARE